MSKTSRIPRAGASLRPRINPAPLSAAEEPPSAPPTPPPLTSDPADVQRWLEGSRDALRDLLAVAEDASRRRKKRMFSRAAARRQIREAFAQVNGLLDVAAEALRRLS